MLTKSCNCIVCAKEFNSSEAEDNSLLSINTTLFKICSNCLESSDPEDDYAQARELVDNYLKFVESYKLFKEVKTFLKKS
jgi:hypothetical protein